MLTPLRYIEKAKCSIGLLFKQADTAFWLQRSILLTPTMTRDCQYFNENASMHIIQN